MMELLSSSRPSVAVWSEYLKYVVIGVGLMQSKKKEAAENGQYE